ncbi:MAG: hypothetical protein J6V09_02750 [Clostridia bacterium]|nr:hypothetical protein [Clostridia bacterium]
MKCAIVDERISEKCERALLTRGFRVIKTPPSENLGQGIMSHPDMLMFVHKNKIISSAEYCEKNQWVFNDIYEYASDACITFTEDKFSPKYPHDAIFNALVIGKHIFYKEDSVSRAVREYAARGGLVGVNVKQGYPACTVLAFGGAAITADRGMMAALTSVGIRVTLISEGDISLPPHEYGFIGGAAGVYKKEIYFLGNLDTHRDKDLIREAIEAEGYVPVSLSDEPLRDLGRIIFIE